MVSCSMIFSSFLGVFPFDTKGRFSVKMSIYSIVIISAMFCQVYLLDRPQSFPKNLKVGWLVKELLNFKNKIIIIAVCAHLVRIMENRAEVVEMLTLVVPTGSVPLGAILGYHVVKIWLEEFLYKTDENLTRWVKILNGLLYNQPSVCLAVVVLQFCDWLSLSRREFGEMYDLMKKQKIFNASAIVDNHARLARFLKTSNSVYGFQILTACLVYGKLMIINLLMLVIGCLSGGEWTDLSEVAISAVYDIAMLTYLSDCCQRCMDIANDFNVELFGLIKNNNANLCCNDKILLYVKTRRTINFTACGFFSLGYPFLTSVVAAVTTYLVILLQYSLTN